MFYRPMYTPINPGAHYLFWFLGLGVISTSYNRLNKEYLAPQIHKMNSQFHSDVKLPQFISHMTIDYPIPNPILSY